MDAGSVFVPDKLSQPLVVGGVLHEVDPCGIHQQHWHIGMLTEVGQVAVLDAGEVLSSDVLFVLAPTLGDVLKQVLRVIVQVQD